MANLVIVESPSKASTIKNYLGSNYKVIASKGHIRDLPKSTFGVDIENNFERLCFLRITTLREERSNFWQKIDYRHQFITTTWIILSKSSQIPYISHILDALEGYKDCTERKEWLISQKERLTKSEQKKMNLFVIRIVLVIICAIILTIVSKTTKYNKMQKSYPQFPI